MGRTLRNKRERALLYFATDGKCRNCGQPLPDDWHADHIIPYSKTGRTNVFEMQAYCPICNLKKGIKVDIYSIIRNLKKARPGQLIAITRSMENVEKKIRFTPVVLPTRYGKSDTMRLSAIIEQSAGLVSTSICLLPNTTLRDQLVKRKKIQKMNERYGIAANYGYKALDEVRFSFYNGLPIFDLASNGEAFIAMTIQLALAHKQDFLNWLEYSIYQIGLPGKLMIDESHFLSMENVWGGLVTDWIERGGYVNLYTATPERYDGLEIPGIPIRKEPIQDIEVFTTSPGSTPNLIKVNVYEGQEVQIAIDRNFIEKNGVYVSFKEAWAENIICHCQRIAVDISLSSCDIRENGIEKLSELPHTKARSLLGKIVRNPFVIKKVVSETIRAIKEVRQTCPDAKVVVYSTSDNSEDDTQNKHAKLIAKEVRRQDPSIKVLIVTSTTGDDQSGADLINGFESSDYDMLIVKRMASQGIDIPSLKVVVDLSAEREVATYIQKLMRGATPHNGHKIFFYITIDDVLSRALYKRFIQDEGGEAIKRIKGELIETYEIERKEKESTDWIIEGVSNSPFSDTHDNEHGPEYLNAAWKVANQLKGIIKEKTLNELIDILKQCEWDIKPNGQVDHIDTEDKRDVLVFQCNDLARTTTKLVCNHRADPDRFSKYISKIWQTAKRNAGFSKEEMDLELKRIDNLNKLEALKKELKIIYSEHRKFHGRV